MDKNVMLMHRDKLLIYTKNLLAYIYKNNDKIISVNDIIAFLNDYDYKKLLIILFTLEGLGYITFITKYTFVFNGYKGVLHESKIFYNYIIALKKENKENNIIEEKKEKGDKYADENNINNQIKEKELLELSNRVLYCKLINYDFEEIKFNDTKLLYIPFAILSMFVNTLIFRLALEPNKSFTKNILDKIIQTFTKEIKDFNYKYIISDAVKILTYMNIVDVSDITPNINFIGSDIYNIIGINIDDFNSIINNNDDIFDSYDRLFKLYNHELKEREKAYFLSIITLNQFNHNNDNNLLYLKHIFSSSLYADGSIDFEKSFAIIKSINFKYYLKKLNVIIGRKNHKEDLSNYQWKVDIDLGNKKKISKQHALIIYNFKNRYFEIYCLSEKFPIKVDDKVLSYKANPIQLYNKSKIKIGGEKILFLLPKQ